MNSHLGLFIHLRVQLFQNWANFSISPQIYTSGCSIKPSSFHGYARYFGLKQR